MRPPRKTDTDNPSAERPTRSRAARPRADKQTDETPAGQRAKPKAPPPGATNRAARRYAARAGQESETSKRSDRASPRAAKEGGAAARSARPQRREGPASERSERPVRVERGERPVRAERSERPVRAERGERPVRAERSERPVRVERGERPVRAERSERPVRVERGERPLRSERPVRGARDDRPVRGRRNDPATRPARAVRSAAAGKGAGFGRGPGFGNGAKAEPVEPQRIARLLARAGVASRRDIERMITEGQIALNGEVLTTPATIVNGLEGITVNGMTVEAIEPTRLFRFHKPAGVLTTARDPGGRPTIFDVLPPDLPRTVPVGRLDMSTEGLLLMTTDGALKRALELPSSGVPRSYRVRAYGEIGQRVLENLIDGISIEGVHYGPIDAGIERRTGRNLWISMTLTEGKNREIRRVLEFLGLQVSRLIRVSYGPIMLDDLPPRGVDEVPPQLVAELMNMLKRNEREDRINRGERAQRDGRTERPR